MGSWESVENDKEISDACADCHSHSSHASGHEWLLLNLPVPLITWLDPTTLLRLEHCSHAISAAQTENFWCEVFMLYSALGFPVPSECATPWAPTLSKDQLEVWGCELCESCGQEQRAGNTSDLCRKTRLQLLKVSTVMASLSQCRSCGFLDMLGVSTGTCTNCGSVWAKSHAEIRQMGIVESQRLRFSDLWHECSLQKLGTLPLLRSLLPCYCLRTRGSSLRTLRDETLNRRPTFLVTRVCLGAFPPDCTMDACLEYISARFVGVFIPCEWQWKPAPRQQRKMSPDMTRDKPKHCMWLFDLSISKFGSTRSHVWSLHSSAGCAEELMSASMHDGLMFGGSCHGALLEISADLRTGCLAAPGQGILTFQIADIEIWAAEDSIDETSLPFEFEYWNQQVNKRILKTVIGGLGSTSSRYFH